MSRTVPGLGSRAVWTIYHDPIDYPGQYVLRLSAIAGGRRIAHYQPNAVAETLDQIRAAVPPGLHRIDRHPLDDPIIVECWV